MPDVTAEDIVVAALDETYDYSDVVETPAVDGSNSLAVLTALAQEQLDAEARVAACQAELTRAQEKLRDISEKRLPETMEKIGMKEFITNSGLKIQIEEKIRSSLSKENKEKGHAWLRANGHAALIKRFISVGFGKGEDDKAAKLFEVLRKRYPETVEDESSVHSSTLSAFVAKQVAAGKEIPFDVFGVHRQQEAKITLPGGKPSVAPTRKGKR